MKITKSMLCAVLLCAAPLSAHAQAVAVSDSTSEAVSVSGSGAEATNAGNSQNITVGGDSYETNVQNRDNTPDSTVVIASPTSPCALTGGVGGSGPGLSLSIGGSKINKKCMLYEQARVVAQGLGDVEWAKQIIRGGDKDADAAYLRAHPEAAPQPEK